MLPLPLVAAAHAKVTFGGVELEASDELEASWSHTEASFTVPAGAGAQVPVVVTVGGRSTQPVFFAYDPPFISSFTPNEFDAQSDLIEIYGRNFASTAEVRRKGGTFPACFFFPPLS